jgi:uncharacterized protein YeaO (DUF488 family)
VLRLKRAYEPAETSDGRRILVDRLWPRGLSKKRVAIDEWMKELSPSPELRRWFDHDPKKWQEFKRRYAAELEAHPDAWKPMLTKARRGRVTLLYSAHDVEHNNAVVLRDFLDRRLESKTKKP